MRVKRNPAGCTLYPNDHDISVNAPSDPLGRPRLRRRLQSLISVATSVTLAAVGLIGVTAQQAAAQEPPAGSGSVLLVLDETEVATFAEAEVESTAETVNPCTGLRFLRPRVARTAVLRQEPFNHVLQDWWHEVAAGNLQSAERNGSLVIFDARGAAIARFDFQNCWPSAVETGSLKAGAEVLTMDVTLTCEHITPVVP